MNPEEIGDVVTRNIWIIADFANIPEKQQAEFRDFLGNRQVIYCHRSDHQIIAPVTKDDKEEILFKFLKNSFIALVYTKNDADSLDLVLSRRQIFFRADTGKMEIFPLFAPLMLSLFLLHAHPAIAGHITSGIDRIISKSLDEQVLDFRISNKEMKIVPLKVAQQNVSNLDKKESRIVYQTPPMPPNLIRKLCRLHDAELLIRTYGDFPELDQKFLHKLRVFEMRLCIRKHLATINKKYQFDPDDQNIEKKIIKNALEYGYDDKLLFSEFAYIYIVMGFDEFSKKEYFENKKEEFNRKSSAVAFGIMETKAMISSIERWGKDYQSNFADEEYFKTEEGKEFLRELKEIEMEFDE